MITASITIQGQPEKRTEILQTINGIKEQLGRDRKCKQVKVYQDIDDENRFVFVENWLNEEDLSYYFSSRMFKVLLGVNSILAEPLEVKLFTEIKH